MAETFPSGPIPDADAAMTGTRWYVLLVMTAVYAMNIADRFVVSTLIEPIRQEFGLGDAAVGVLTGAALATFYVAAGIPLGMLADRVNRARLVAASLAAWSVLTALCGFTHGFWQLLVTRIGVGIGEAGGTPPSQSLLADYFTPRTRAFAMSLYALGAAAGAAIGSTLGGALNDAYGWRTVLIVFGLMGLPIALLVLATVREPARGRYDPAPRQGEAAAAPGIAAALRLIAASPPLVHLLAGATILTFAGWGLVWWLPTFLLRSHGMSLHESGAALGWMHGVGGAGVTLATAWAMARLSHRDWTHQARFVALVTVAATLPAIVAFACAPPSRGLMLAMLWIFVPATYLYIGPTLAIAQNLVAPGMRGLICAVILFVANTANLVVAPILIGALSDLLAPHLAQPADALRLVLLAMAPTGLWAAWHYHAAARGIRTPSSAA